MAAPLEAAESAFPSLMRVDKGGGGSAAITADSHVSLSRSCAIRFQQIESLVALLKHGFLGQHMCVWASNSGISKSDSVFQICFLVSDSCANRM